MKTFTLIVGLFISIARLAAAVIIDPGSLPVLNDPHGLKQIVLERVNSGEVNASCSFANNEQPKSIQFKVAPGQASFSGLVATVPSFDFTTLDTDRHLTANLWGSFAIDDETVFGFGGSIEPITVKAGDLEAGINGWIVCRPVTITVDGMKDVDIYARMPWGALNRVQKQAGNTFAFDPALSGHLGLAVITYGGGRVTGYDFDKRKYLTSREVWVYLNSFQGDVDLSVVGPGNAGLQREIYYWVNESSAFGVTPIYELTVDRTGQVDFDLNLKTYVDSDSVEYQKPEILWFDVYFLDVNKKWVPVPTSISQKGDYQHRGTSFKAATKGIYRVVPHIENLQHPPYSDGKG